MAKAVTLSERGRRMPASPIRKLVPYADAAKARGVHVYHLNIGQPDIETPAAMIEAYRALDRRVIEYGPSGGLATYVEALAGYYGRVGIDVEPSQILVTTGGSEALAFVFQAVAGAGDEIIVPEPFYTNYNGFAVMSGVTLVPIATRAEDGFALPERERFEERITDRTRAILLCNPGNPTGAVYSREEMSMLEGLVAEHGLFLIADEVYREFVYDGVEHVSVLDLPSIPDRAVLVDSISKQYSACGARLGCIVSRNAELMATVLKFGQARLCPPTVDQIAATAALSVPDTYFEAVRSEYVKRRDLTCDTLASIPDVICQKPRGAFYTVAKLPVEDAEQFAVFLLDGFELDGETVMVAPAAGFYATPGAGRDEVRIAYVLNTTDLGRAMRAFAAGLEAFRADR